MRDPDNIKQIDEVNNHLVITFNELPEYDIDDYDLFDEKDFKKYIDDIEKAVRSSFEYREYTNYLRTYMDMNKCSFYKNVNNIDTFKIKIEIHHEPITLYDMCIVVYNKRLAMHEDLDVEMVAKEVMYLHYCMYVGLIPLAETVHELVHGQYLFVPTSKVFGFYKKFIESYKDYFLPEQLDILDKIETATTSLDNSNDYKDLLNVDYIYIDASGAYDLPKASDVVSMMKSRIYELKYGENITIEDPKQMITPVYFVK